jgi:hypothetical protein
MKPIHGFLVELENKKLCYNGIPLEYDFIKKASITASFKEGLAMPSDYDSPLLAPDRGLFINSSDPDFQEGDQVILEYFAVIKKLGTSIEEFQKDPHDIHEMVDGKVRIPVNTRIEQYVYAIFRNGEFIPYKNWCIVELIEEPKTGKLHLLTLDKKTEKYVEQAETKKCRILYGENPGMICLYDEHYLLGQAQRSVIDGVEVRFIQEQYLLAEVEV